ncbi:hypothetical protein KM043_011487 [Ampulex compressa]|nr:hypothetical protein KM043_011487 [Ampulex compressa]
MVINFLPKLGKSSLIPHKSKFLNRAIELKARKQGAKVAAEFAGKSTLDTIMQGTRKVFHCPLSRTDNPQTSYDDPTKLADHRTRAPFNQISLMLPSIWNYQALANDHDLPRSSKVRGEIEAKVEVGLAGKVHYARLGKK